MASRNLRRWQTGSGQIEARGSFAVLSGALFLLGICGTQVHAASAQTQANSAEAAPQKFPKANEEARLEDKLTKAGAGQVDAVREELIAWLESLETVTFASAPHDLDALSALYFGGVCLAQRPELSAQRDAWFGLAERALHNIQDPTTHRYLNTGLLVTQAQDLLRHKGERRALELMERALVDDLEPDLEPLALHTLAEAQRRTGNKLKSLESLTLADASIEKHGPGFAQGPSLLAQGELLRAQNYVDLGVPDLAWSSLVRCKDAARKAELSEVLDTATLIEVDLLFATDRKEDVIDLLGPTGKMKEGPLSEKLQLRLGKAYADLDPITAEDAAKAVNLIEGVLENETLDPEDRRSAHISLIDFQIRRGDMEAAEAHVSAARAELGRLQQTRDAGIQPNDQAELEAYSSRLLRARGFDAASGKAQLVELKTAFDRLIDELGRNERPRGGVGFLHFRTRRFILNELIELSIAVEGQKRGFELALEALIEAQELGSLSRALGQMTYTSSDVRRAMIRADGGMLVFVPDHQRTLVLAFDVRPSGLCVPVASQNIWRPVVDKWLQAVTTAPAELDEKARARNLSAIDTQGKRVAELLLPAAIRERMAGWKWVTIVGADLMNGLPFEALPLDGGELLGVRLAVDRAPSLPLGFKLAARRWSSPRPPALQAGLWLVAAPTIPEWADKSLRDLARIPFDDVNKLALLRPYPAFERSCFVGETATRSALEDPRLALASVLQVTAHGIERSRVERPAALVLRPMSKDDDGLLDCDDVEKLHVPDTVVLSACGAARGEQRFGEDGLNHLGGAFMWAGASCVVLSSHPVEAQAMQALMEVFHQRLCAGDSRAESMRAARATVAKNPRFSHPFYYSLVQVVGLGQSVR